MTRPENPITREQVAEQSLEQILSGNEEEIKTYKFTHNLAKTYLFSMYEERKAYALAKLTEYWNTPVNIKTLTSGGVIYCYIEFNNLGEYILVDRFAENDPTFEEVPEAEEIQDWQRLRNKSSQP